MLEFLRDTERVLAKIQKGERLILTHRGKAVACLEPIRAALVDPEDSFYDLCDLAEPAGRLTNSEIDELVYGR
jgi:antitoxin (DNA-binding transcriptional repressor) of toxin-antitoxin stability system